MSTPRRFSLADACRLANVSRSAVYNRMRIGMNLDQAIASARDGSRGPYKYREDADRSFRAQTHRLLAGWRR